MLTAKTIKTLTKQRTLDAHGLYCCVSPSGARKWTYRYRQQGRSREMGLGGYPEVSLQQARIKRDVQRALRNEGLDPLEEKQRQARQKLAAGEQTFARAAAFAYDVKREELTNPKYAKLRPLRVVPGLSGLVHLIVSVGSHPTDRDLHGC